MVSRQNEADYRPSYPCFGSITITPSDSTVLSPVCRRLYIGGAGSVTVRMLDGSSALFTAPPVGTFIDIQFDQVKATGTTATLMVALY